MPGKKRTFGTPEDPGIPRISCDPLWIQDPVIWVRMDITSPNFVRPAYGDSFPGYLDPDTETVLWQSMQCVNVVTLDDKFIDVAYRDIPGSMMYIWQSLSDLHLPDTLTSIGVTYETGLASGASSHPASQQHAVFAGAGTISYNPRAQAQGSVSILPDILPAITSVWARDLPTTNFSFQIPNSSPIEYILARITSAYNQPKTTVTIATDGSGYITWPAHGFSNGATVLFSTTGELPSPIVTTQVYYVSVVDADTFRITATPNGSLINPMEPQSGVQQAVAAIQSLPVFKPQFYSFVAVGFHQSGSLEADSLVSLSSRDGITASALSSEWGNGFSKEIGIQTKTLRVGPVLNGAITWTETSTAGPVTISADASTAQLPSSGTALVPAISNTPTALSLTATGIVTSSAGNSLPASSPASIPAAGVYLIDLNPAVHDDELLLVHAAIIDFSIFS